MTSWEKFGTYDFHGKLIFGVPCKISVLSAVFDIGYQILHKVMI